MRWAGVVSRQAEPIEAFADYAYSDGLQSPDVGSGIGIGSPALTTDRRGTVDLLEAAYRLIAPLDASVIALEHLFGELAEICSIVGRTSASAGV